MESREIVVLSDKDVNRETDSSDIEHLNSHKPTPEFTNQRHADKQILNSRNNHNHTLRRNSIQIWDENQNIGTSNCQNNVYSSTSK